MSDDSTPRDSLRRHPAYVRYWFARVASGFAFQMLSVAAGWQIYDLTHRAFDLGLIGLVQFVPSLLLVLPAGHIADHYDRRRIVLVCVIVEGLAIALLAVASARSNSRPRWRWRRRWFRLRFFRAPRRPARPPHRPR